MPARRVWSGQATLPTRCGASADRPHGGAHPVRRAGRAGRGADPALPAPGRERDRWGEADVLVTDDGVAADARDLLDERVDELIIARAAADARGHLPG